MDVTEAGAPARDERRIARMNGKEGARASARDRVRGPARLIVAVVAVWAGLGVFMGVQFYVNGAPGGKAVELWPGIELSVRRYLIYAVLTFPVLWLCRRFPPASRRWLVPLTAHLGGLLAFVVLYAALRTLSGSAVERGTLAPMPITVETALAVMRSGAYEQLTMYVTIVIAALAVQYHRAWRERGIHEADLKRHVAEYELQVLKLQLHPHFLFNAMNGIATLIARDPKIAREMLVRLSELLRMALSRSAENEVSLREEIEFVKAYLEIERMRFGERLKVELAIDQASLEARVPNMIIQPLVENAIEYGISRSRAGGTLGLAAQCVDDRLRILIVNDGPSAGDVRNAGGGSGVGMSNARSRLTRLYGEDFRLRLEERPQGGATLFLEMPLRTAARAVEARA
jgi:hypothetical protein